MTLGVELISGRGAKNSARINGEGELSVVVHPHPPKDEQETALPFRQYFTATGQAGGSFDMRVNASAASPQDFYIQAVGDYDIYLKTLSIIISDAGATLSEFGNLASLTNGIEFGWDSQDVGEIIIADSIKTNFEFMRLAIGNPPLGGGTDAFQAANVVSTSEAYIPTINFAEIFGLQYGIRLRKGTKDRLYFKIKDNVSGVDQFDAIAYGIRF